MDNFKMQASKDNALADNVLQEFPVVSQERRWANTPHDRPAWPLNEHTRQGELAFAIANRGLKEVKMVVAQGSPILAEFPLADTDHRMGNALDLTMQHRRFQLALFLMMEPQGQQLAQQSVFAL